MFDWLRRKLTRRRPAPAEPRREEEEDRTSGEEARHSHDVSAEETSAPGTPRLGSKNL